MMPKPMGDSCYGHLSQPNSPVYLGTSSAGGQYASRFSQDLSTPHLGANLSSTGYYASRSSQDLSTYQHATSRLDKRVHCGYTSQQSVANLLSVGWPWVNSNR
ncbi:hypothetical protein BDV98DRAFT_571537 [Pterulicium gracile]|uniref:Uncharacterized protein n=1 Tax=Pterulicium gracile TaxID=1884261 RepID=A0A5C3QM04_9AGAR|nr:hypothetical protein BDV98DRAFT_571537 [Pterula gracilis]